MLFLIAILAPYAWAVVLFWTIGTPIWPGLVLSCAIAALRDWRVALVFAAPVLLVQVAKATVPGDHVWVYYAAIWATIGMFSAAVFCKKVIAPAAFLIALLFLAKYFGAPAVLIDLTEVVFMAALVTGAILGTSGGIFSDVGGTSRSPANRRDIPVGGLRAGHFVSVRRRGDLGNDQGDSVSAATSG